MLGFRMWQYKRMKYYDPNERSFISLSNMNGDIYCNEGDYGSGFYHETDGIPMQSTGLADHNDVEIFEGDVVQIYHTMHIYLVKLPEFLITLGEWNSALDNEAVYKHITVLGNIYENPELLEKIKDENS